MPVESDCPCCGNRTYSVVKAKSSRRPGRIPYRVCQECESPYDPSQRWTMFEWMTGLIVGVGLIIGAFVLFLQGGVDFVIRFWMMAIGLLMVGLSLIFRNIDTGKSKLVTLIGGDDQLSAQARERLLTQQRPQGFDQAMARAGRKANGWILVGIGGLISFSSAGLILNITQGKMEFGFGINSLLLAAACLGAILGPGLYVYGKRLKAPLAMEVLRKGGPPPTLLLRSFVDDFAPLPHVEKTMRNVYKLGSKDTLEDEVARVFRKVGPVVAIGRPGEKLPPSGAARVWLPDDQWQPCVHDFLACSAFVVMVLGDPKDGDGLSWEIQQIFTHTQPYKIILLVPPHLDEATVRERWRKYTELSSGRVTDYQEGVLMVRFRSDWSPVFACVKRSATNDELGWHGPMKTALEQARDFRGLS